MREDLNDELIVMIAGEFKAGKSTFINTLMGERIVTSDAPPTTSIITKLTYGPERQVIVHFRNGEIEIIKEEMLHLYTTELNAEYAAVREKIELVEIQLPHELLRNITILDSPGLGAIHDHHTEATQNFIHRADVLIWLFDYGNTGLASELQQIAKLKKQGLEPIMIVNKIDYLDEEEDDLEDFLMVNKQRLGTDKLIGVSAKLAMQAKQSGDIELLDFSNWEEVEDIFSNLIQRKEGIKQQRSIEKFILASKSLIAELEKEKKYLQEAVYYREYLIHVHKLVQSNDRISDLHSDLKDKEKPWNYDHVSNGKELLHLLKAFQRKFGKEELSHVFTEYYQLVGRQSKLKSGFEKVTQDIKKIEKNYQDLSEARYLKRVLHLWKVNQLKEKAQSLNELINHYQSASVAHESKKKRFHTDLITAVKATKQTLYRSFKKQISEFHDLAVEYNELLTFVRTDYNQIERYIHFHQLSNNIVEAITNLLAITDSSDHDIALTEIAEHASTLAYKSVPDLQEAYMKTSKLTTWQPYKVEILDERHKDIGKLLSFPKFTFPDPLELEWGELERKRNNTGKLTAALAAIVLIVPSALFFNNSEETEANTANTSRAEQPVDTDNMSERTEEEDEVYNLRMQFSEVEELVDALRTNKDNFILHYKTTPIYSGLTDEEAAEVDTFNKSYVLDDLEDRTIKYETEENEVLIDVTESIAEADKITTSAYSFRLAYDDQEQSISVLSFDLENLEEEPIISHDNVENFMQQLHNTTVNAYNTNDTSNLEFYLGASMVTDDVIAAYTNTEYREEVDATSFTVNSINDTEKGFSVDTTETYEYKVDGLPVSETRESVYSLTVIDGQLYLQSITVNE
ncbi:dynamin family protein, partial [Terribacillus saccharophilus]|uniref:dynamin family protein n=1 Tax=Terribacillus saccharophilus TaxID=361277 RepID=UPI002DC2353F|nr:dynamin family protein [Terribacillus saccharophilus]